MGKKTKHKDLPTAEEYTVTAFYNLTDEEIDNIIRNHLGEGVNSNNRWSKSEMIIRNQAIIDMVTRGMSRNKIVTTIQSRWNVCEGTAYSYYKKALETLCANNDEFVEYNRGIQQERLENILNDCIAHRDRKNAIATITALNKLLGLDVNRVEVDMSNTKFEFGGEA